MQEDIKYLTTKTLQFYILKEIEIILLRGATGSDEPWAGSAAAAGSLSRLHQTVLG
jgi:hypothetical protein